MKMRNKINIKNRDRKSRNKWLLSSALIVLAVIALFVSFSAIAQSSQDEINSLSSEISASGYDWLVNYTLTSAEMPVSSIEVYEYNQSRVIALFDNVSAEGYYRILLTNLTGAECYDNETEILTENGWKLFSELNGNERVITLNNNTGQKEWQDYSDKKEFDYNSDLYDIKLADGSDLKVSSEHKVYAHANEDKNKWAT